MAGSATFTCLTSADHLAHSSPHRSAMSRARFGARRAGKDLREIVNAGHRHVQLEEETIELRFRQRIRAFHLDRVLRREDRERLLERMRHAKHRDMPLLHRFEKRRLRSRRGPIELVGEHDVGEDAARLKRELTRTRRAFRPADWCR